MSIRWASWLLAASALIIAPRLHACGERASAGPLDLSTATLADLRGALDANSSRRAASRS